MKPCNCFDCLVTCSVFIKTLSRSHECKTQGLNWDSFLRRNERRRARSARRKKKRIKKKKSFLCLFMNQIKSDDTVISLCVGRLLVSVLLAPSLTPDLFVRRPGPNSF